MTATRFTLGPSFGFKIDDAPARPDAKPDVDVSLLSVDPATRTVKVGVPPYNPDVFSRLVEVRAYLYPTGSRPGADGPAFANSGIPFTAAYVADTVNGAEVEWVLPEVPAGEYVGQVVLGFED